MQAGAVTITAEGNSVAKAITVAEITRRQLGGLHQNTQIGVLQVMADEGNAVIASSQQPSIIIILSLIPLDPTLPG